MTEHKIDAGAHDLSGVAVSTVVAGADQTLGTTRESTTLNANGPRHRYARDGDVAEIADLIERAYRGPDASAGWTTEAHLLESPRSDAEEIRRLVADPDSRFSLAERHGRLVACALVQRTGDDAYFGMFAVDPRMQAGGIGSEVLAACESAARDLWASRAMTMSVISVRLDLIAWYVRRGYATTGNRQPFPFHEKQALRDDFDLVQLGKDL